MIFKRYRKQYAIGLERELRNSRRDLELETARRQELQRNELALLEARDEARECVVRAEEEQAKALDRVGSLLETRDRVMMERDLARDAVEDMGYGIHAIHGERMTHTSEHDHDAAHDDVYSYHQLATAAAVYAAPFEIYDYAESRPGLHRFELAWPWAETTEPKITRPVPDLRNEPHATVPQHGRREARIHELAKAGALIAAEIERIVRLGGSESTAAPGRRSVSEGLIGPGPGRDR